MRQASEPERRHVAPPLSCPFCRSLHPKTTTKIIDESTYWRCLTCGEIWNPGRLRSTASVNRGVLR